MKGNLSRAYTSKFTAARYMYAECLRECASHCNVDVGVISTRYFRGMWVGTKWVASQWIPAFLRRVSP